MTPRKELLDFFATREPPNHRPDAGKMAAAPPRGGESEMIVSMRAVEIDCGDCDCEYCRPPQPITWDAADVRAAYVLGFVSGVIMTALFVRAW